MRTHCSCCSTHSTTRTHGLPHRCALRRRQAVWLPGGAQPEQQQQLAATQRRLHGLARRPARNVAARVYKGVNDELADRVREVWDDEEDVQAAAARLGYDRDTLAADSGPLITDINELYVEPRYPQEGYIGQLELRYLPGKGYGLVARQEIAQGTLLAVCLPLAWVSGPPGQPPPLEALVSLLARTQGFTQQQRRVLAALASTTALDDAHDNAQRQRQQEAQQDPLLRAAAELQEASSAPGLPAGSLPLSKAAALRREQRRLRARSEFLSLDRDDDEEDGEGGEGEDEDDGGGYWAGGSQRLLGGGAPARGLARRSAAAAVYRHERAAPDLLDFLECTQPAAAAAAAAAAEGSARRWGSGGGGGGSSSAALAAVAERGAPLNFPTDRLSALVCRNALVELSHDLTTATIRGEDPASLTGLWPLLALFNHSCAPNAAAVTIGHQPPQQQQQEERPAGLLRGQAGGQQARLRAASGSSGSNGSSGAAAPANPWAVGSRQQRQAAPGGSGQLARPDASLTYCSEAGRGPFVLVRAAADLSAGDEVTLDYLSAGIEGSLVHQERRKAALGQRWGFTCRCERCTAEQQLGRGLARTVHLANSVASQLGPKVAAAAGAAAAAQAAAEAAAEAAVEAQAAAALAEAEAAAGSEAAAAAAAAAERAAEAAAAAAAAAAGAPGGEAGSPAREHEGVLREAADRLSAAIADLESQVDTPTTPARVAAWAHASMYQVHALSAVAEVRLAPRGVKALACIGTAASLAGLAAPGSPVHLLGMAGLVAGSGDAWGEEDARVNAALQGLLKVLQLRYGPLKAGIAGLMARSAQRWWRATEVMPLGLLSPAAAAAVQARKQLARGALLQQQQEEEAAAARAAGRGRGAQPGAGSGSARLAQQQAAAGAEEEEERAGEEEEDDLAAELALDADEVVEVSDDEVDALYGQDAGEEDEEDDQHQRLRQLDDAEGWAVARVVPGLGGGGGGGDEDDGELMLVRQRREQDVRAELKLYEGLRQTLPPEQRRQQQQRQQQQQQQQQRRASDQGAAGSFAAGTPDDPWRPREAPAGAAVGDDGGRPGAAGAAGSEQQGAAGEQELPLLTSWLQGQPAGLADLQLDGEQQQPQQPVPTQQQQQQERGQVAAPAAASATGQGRDGQRSASKPAGRTMGSRRTAAEVKSLFAPKKQQQQQQQQQPAQPMQPPRATPQQQQQQQPLQRPSSAPSSAQKGSTGSQPRQQTGAGSTGLGSQHKPGRPQTGGASSGSTSKRQRPRRAKGQPAQGSTGASD